MGARRIAGDLDQDMRSLAGAVVAGEAVILKPYIERNINPSGGLSLQGLEDAGYPLSASGFRPGAAGLAKEYQIIRQSGGLQDSLGIAPLQRSVSTVRTFVGFDDAGSHRSSRANGTTRTVDMNRLLNWLINGTATLVGRPVLINSLGEAIPEMKEYLEDLGLRRRSKGASTTPRAGVVK